MKEIFLDLDLLDAMPFGKHKGILIGTLIEEERDYISWAIREGIISLNEEANKYYEAHC